MEKQYVALVFLAKYSGRCNTFDCSFPFTLADCTQLSPLQQTTMSEKLKDMTRVMQDLPAALRGLADLPVPDDALKAYEILATFDPDRCILYWAFLRAVPVFEDSGAPSTPAGGVEAAAAAPAPNATAPPLRRVGRFVICGCQLI